MTAKQFKDALHRLGLTQAAAADLFKVSIATIDRWSNGRSRVPHLVWLYLNERELERLASKLKVEA